MSWHGVLRIVAQSCSSIPSFKKNFSTRHHAVNYYFTGSQIEQKLHARIRSKCRCLKYTLFNTNVIQNKLCVRCEMEDTFHFQFCCIRFTVKPVLSGNEKEDKIGFKDRLLLNVDQKYCRMLQWEYSAILSTFIKLPVVFETFACLFLSGRLRQVLLYYTDINHN